MAVIAANTAPFIVTARQGFASGLKQIPEQYE